MNGLDRIDINATKDALKALGIDELGLEKLDRDILSTIITRFGGGPVGIDTIAAAIGEEKVTIEDAYEPYLIQQKGRMVTEAAYRHMGYEVPEQIRLAHADRSDSGSDDGESGEDGEEQQTFIDWNKK